MLWNFIYKQLKSKQKVALLYVVQSKNSSPGRQGFKMAVNQAGEMVGSIGGGIMEHKLVEMAKDLLVKNKTCHSLRQQIHRKDSPKNRSGMICSGEQSIVISILDDSHKTLVQNINTALEKRQKGLLQIDQKGLAYEQGRGVPRHFNFQYEAENKWLYQEEIACLPTVHIIGAGHVGLALSEVMFRLDFRVHLYDDRESLNTMANNHFVHKKIITPYEKIAQYIPESPDDYVIIMTFGYRGDEMVLRKLIDKKVAYLGMMGSKAKVSKMFENLLANGFTKEQLERVFAPIGLPISSKTPAEIAISVAAQVLLVKNG